MKLYAYRNCPYCRRVRIALREKGIDFSYVELSPKEPHPEEIRGKCPSESGVPVLKVSDDFVLWDSAAILGWLDKAFPTSLTPGAMEPMAIADGWIGWAASTLYPKLHSLLEGDAEKVAGARRKIIAALKTAAPLVPEDGWLVASMFSNADVSMAAVLAVLPSDLIAELPPRVRGYVERLRARPSVQQVCDLDVGDRPSRAA